MGKTEKILTFVFGPPGKKRFKRIIIVLITITISVILIQNVGCGLTPEGKFWFEWRPAADIKINK